MCLMAVENLIGFNTQPLEGGWFFFEGEAQGINVSTHSRSKAAGQA